ncbi:beta-ketoacyl synthase N-terminal-like domain-containing protein [Streptomyces sp. CRN 30]|uniref:beta-ketoacyl synthase N-terminal-like domain-containing protein n=1 Tax=Streptomyces sp. CRN 30 TaxID=3075613 RepID=UPI002A7F5EED|nr:beta-ketoacyl synthase N-terminal-like domain-containing protein [Streptomyces sp. CRN 30]
MAGESSGTDAVAIVGLGCRLPGGIVDLAGLWEALEAGRDLVGTVPEDRFETERFVDTAMARPGPWTGSVSRWPPASTGWPRTAAPRRWSPR